MDEDEMQPQIEDAAGEAMPEEELIGLLGRMQHQAVNYYSSEIAQEQERALHYYYGRPFGDERAGYSQVVDLTVSTVVDNALAAILKPFVGSDKPAEFQPSGPDDGDAAEQATDYVSHVLMQECDGFNVLMTAARDGLLQKLGVAKVWWEDKSAPKTETIMVSADEFEAVAAEVVAGPFETGEPGVFEVQVQRQYEDGCVVVDPVPPEEFRISPLSRSLDAAPYIAHVVHKTRSDLIAMGFDRALIESLQVSDSASFDDPRRLARWSDEDEAGARAGIESDKSQQLLEVMHEFPLVDYDGDGISERRNIVRCGNTILYNEVVEDHPFVAWCPVPVSHKVYGRSFADMVADEQRVRSVLIRQQLDNLYMTNQPATELPEGAERTDGSTVQALSNMTIGSVVPTRQPGMLKPIVIPFVADKAFAMLEASERRIMGRVGVSMVGQGLDPESLQRDRTATEAMIQQTGRDDRLEMVARIFGAEFVGKMYRKMLRLLVRHQPRAKTIRLRGEWVQMDPRHWNVDMDVTVNVGLGVNGKREKLAQAMQQVAILSQVGATPYGQFLVSPQNAYEAAKMALEAAGQRTPELLLSEPDPEAMAAQQPDPETLKAQAEMQMKQAEQQAKMQEAAAKLQLMREEAGAKLEFERERAALEAELAREKAAREYELAVAKMQAEMNLAREKMAMEYEMAREAAQLNAAAKVASVGDSPTVSSYRPGGDLDK